MIIVRLKQNQTKLTEWFRETFPYIDVNERMSSNPRFVVAEWGANLHGRAAT
jgi:hypothetical protein